MYLCLMRMSLIITYDLGYTCNENMNINKFLP